MELVLVEVRIKVCCEGKGMCVSIVTVKKNKKTPRETRPCQTVKRSIILPRAPVPFWHIVKVVCSSVYQIQILCDGGFV